MAAVKPKRCFECRFYLIMFVTGVICVAQKKTSISTLAVELFIEANSTQANKDRHRGATVIQKEKKNEL